MNIRTGKLVKGRIGTFYVDNDSRSIANGSLHTHIVHVARHVVSHRRVINCNCMDFTQRRCLDGGQCKHIKAVLEKFPAFAPKSNRKTSSASTNKSGMGLLANSDEKVEVRKSAKQMLTEIVNFLNKEDEASTILWDILAALRGPDKYSPGLVVKELTTARIRGMIGLNRLGLIISPCVPIASDFKNYGDAVEKTKSALDPSKIAARGLEAPYDIHFVRHYASALESLRKIGLI
jgi:hypothetical protein